MTSSNEDILAEYTGLNSHKPIIILHPYRDCNIDCSCCYIRHGGENTFCTFKRDGLILSARATEKLMVAAKRLDATMFTGAGEPFLYWKEYTLPILIPLANKYGIHLTLSTNGLWGSNDKIIDELIENFKGVISFSVDYWHKVPIENVNHAIDRLASPSVKNIIIYMSQIVDKDHPKGHIKPHHFDDMFVKYFEMNNNGNDQQALYNHDKQGNLIRKW